jgi:two-component system, OmpR family, alkaline phosphatase synthesis response regulator PhoP
MPIRALIAEDDRDIRLVARLALRRAGFDVTAVDDGEALLAVVRDERPDVILLDWMMPVLDGPETCARLKADPATAGIPVVFLTAKTQQAEVERGMALGAVGYIAKPFDALALGEQVRALIGR